MNKLLWLIGVLIISAGAASGQPDSLHTDERIIEEYAETFESETGKTPLYEYLEYFKNFPVSLEAASLNDLLKIPFINGSAVRQILDSSAKEGTYDGNIPGIPDLEPVKPYIRLKSYKEEAAKFAGSLRIRCSGDLQNARGYSEDIYQGSPLKTYGRLQMHYGPDLFVNLLAEKDPGEKNYADFSSFSLMASGQQWRAVGGDYKFEFGQGMVMWGSGGFTAGGDAVFPVIKRERGIIPYTGAGEYSFLRGAAAEFVYKNINVRPFFSFKKLDAVIDTASGAVLSMPEDGLHRTENENSHKNRLNESLFGVSAGFDDKKMFSGGIFFCHQEYDRRLEIQNSGGLSGSAFNLISLSYRMFWNKYFFSGEVAGSGKYAAAVNSLEIMLSPDISIISSYRNYQSGYNALYSSGFGHSGRTGNEWGFYNGFKINSDYGTFNVYFDFFKFPSSNYYSPLPVTGNEFYFGYSGETGKNLQYSARFRATRLNDVISASGSGASADNIKYSVKAELVYGPSKSIQLKSRGDYVYYSAAGRGEEGYAVMQDIRVLPLKKISLYARLTVFKTGSYKAAVYEYENDLAGIISSVPLFGSGLRTYLMAVYRILPKVAISMKYSETYKPDEKSLGSGYSEIQGSIDNSISLQADIAFQ